MSKKEPCPVGRWATDDPQSTPDRERLREALSEVERLKGLLHRDRTGLGAALAQAIRCVQSWRWIPAGEWGSYDYTQQTVETLRAEVTQCFEEILSVAEAALHRSGKLADEAFRTPSSPWRPIEECGELEAGRQYLAGYEDGGGGPYVLEWTGLTWRDPDTADDVPTPSHVHQMGPIRGPGEG